jgi:toxin ParE1/3/4
MEQADHYILSIRNACAALADGSKQGRAIDNIRSKYRKLTAQSHLLFYRRTHAGRIDVARSLHRNMDMTAHLRD